jgi:hypothetical protein
LVLLAWITFDKFPEYQSRNHIFQNQLPMDGDAPPLPTLRNPETPPPATQLVIFYHTAQPVIPQFLQIRVVLTMF